jgi:hypothetical protein
MTDNKENKVIALSEEEVRNTIRSVIREELIKKLIFEGSTVQKVLDPTHPELKQAFSAYVLHAWKNDIDRINIERQKSGKEPITVDNAANILLSPEKKEDPSTGRVLTSYALQSPNTLLKAWDAAQYGQRRMAKMTDDDNEPKTPETEEGEEATHYKTGDITFKVIADMLASIPGIKPLTIPAVQQISAKAEKWLDTASGIIKQLDQKDNFTAQKAVEVLRHVEPGLTVDDLTTFASLIDACEDVAIKLFITSLEGLEEFNFDSFFSSINTLANRHQLTLDFERPENIAEYEAIAEIWDLVAEGDYEGAKALLKEKSDEPYFTLLKNLTAAVSKKVLNALSGVEVKRAGRPRKEVS